MPDIQVTQDPAAVIAIVALIGIAAAIAAVFGTGVFSRVPRTLEARPASTPPSEPPMPSAPPDVSSASDPLEPADGGRRD